LRKKNEQLLNLQREYQNENIQLEQALKDINNSLKTVKVSNGGKGDVNIQCPSLEKLLNVYLIKNFNFRYSNIFVLKVHGIESCFKRNYKKFSFV
jgi:hypothetical protein